MGNKPKVCPYQCGNSYQGYNALHNHKKTCPGKQNLPAQFCQFGCGNSYNTKRGLARHQRCCKLKRPTVKQEADGGGGVRGVDGFGGVGANVTVGGVNTSSGNVHVQYANVQTLFVPIV